MVALLREVPAHPGSPYNVLVCEGGLPNNEQRMAMAVRMQELERGRRMAFKWAMPDLSKAAVPAVPKSEGSDILAGVEALDMGANPYAQAINAVVGAGGPNPGLVKTASVSSGGNLPAMAPSTGGSQPGKPGGGVEGPAKPIVVKPGETLLEAARRTLKEQQGK
jgi:hypothetical protein